MCALFFFAVIFIMAIPVTIVVLGTGVKTLILAIGGKDELPNVAPVARRNSYKRTRPASDSRAPSAAAFAAIFQTYERDATTHSGNVENRQTRYATTLPPRPRPYSVSRYRDFRVGDLDDDGAHKP